MLDMFNKTSKKYTFMKKIGLLILSFLFIGNITAQESADTTKNWTLKGVAGANMSQVSLSNWSAGGDGSIAFDLMFNYSADYKKDRHLWQNRLELGYGLNNTTTNGTRKTNDKIYLSSMYGYKVAKQWYLSAFTTFQTQFAKGYNYDVSRDVYISRFLSPGYLSVGVGATWTPAEWFTLTLSPATWRGTFVRDDMLSDAGAFGVTPGKHLLSEFGGNAKAEVKYEFLPNMTLYSRLDLFSNYLENPQNVDVNWDIQIQMKVNKWVSANLQLNMIYDDDTKIPQKDGTSGPRLQFKELLGIGMQVTF